MWFVGYLSSLSHRKFQDSVNGGPSPPSCSAQPADLQGPGSITLCFRTAADYAR